MGESFELLVRPNVSPNIRPGPAQFIRPSATPWETPSGNPELGKAIFGGVGTSVVKTSTSVQASWSRSRPTETKRVVDEERIYQKESDGKVNRENFVDVQRAKKITMQEGNGELKVYHYQMPAPKDNIEVLRSDVTIINRDAPPVESAPPPPTEGGGGGGP